MEVRNNPINFTLRESSLMKLNVLAEEMNFKSLPVFITRRIIVPYYRRIDRNRFDRGLICKNPFNETKLSKSKEKTSIVHVRLTQTEFSYLQDLMKYHNFIDENNVPQYSRFLASAIARLWDDRDEESPEEKPVVNNKDAISEFLEG